MPECIHGLDESMCDICHPKPARVAAATPARKPRLQRASLRTPTEQQTKTGAGRSATVSVGAQRIYHVTHRQNLGPILRTGGLTARAAEVDPAAPVVDISSAEHRAARGTAEVSVIDYLGRNLTAVAEYVPFALTPDASFWASVRDGEHDERLSLGAQRPAPSEFVVLVSTVDKVDSSRTLVAGGEASDPLTRFATTPDSCAGELRRLLVDEEQLREAELLVRESFPFESVSLVAVANDRVRDEVSALLRESGYSTKVVVYPPWFLAVA